MRFYSAVVLCALALNVSGKDVYVATNGIDAGNSSGSLGEPFGTFSNAVGQLSAGDTLLICGGTYNEQFRYYAFSIKSPSTY